MIEIGQQVVKYMYGDIVDVGTVISISDKRKDITVEFGRTKYKETFNSSGYSRERYSTVHIAPMTDEIKKELMDSKIIRICINTFEKTKNNLSVESAKAILEILKKEVENG